MQYRSEKMRNILAQFLHRHHHFICPIIQQYAHLHRYNSRRAGQQGPTRTLTAAVKRVIKQLLLLYHTSKILQTRKLEKNQSFQCCSLSVIYLPHLTVVSFEQCEATDSVPVSCSECTPARPETRRSKVKGQRQSSQTPRMGSRAAVIWRLARPTAV